jgi:MFS family permease
MGELSAQNVPPANRTRLLLAGSFGIFAAGIGFAIRGAILHDWGAEFGFDAAELGTIAGAGFSGYCLGVIAGGLICDRVGYGRVIAAAFIQHLGSAVIPYFALGANAFPILYGAMFLFGTANGTLEAVANPLVATLYPRSRAHHLNLLHASYPASLAIGGALGWILDDGLHVNWRLQLSLILVPTLLYGTLFWLQKMPRSEAASAGLRSGEMLQDIGVVGGALSSVLFGLFLENALMLPPLLSWAVAGIAFVLLAWKSRLAVGSGLLCVLFVVMGLIGAVELGTDGWIQNITANILTSADGKILFVAASLLMFALRFCMGSIEARLRISPVSILFFSSLLAAAGLTLASGLTSFATGLLALLIYAAGKSFFWPTMLAITADRFPRSGAVAISLMGGIGFLSAGMIGTPGLGYAKDRFAGEYLQQHDPEAYRTYAASEESRFLFLPPVRGLDGKKVEEIRVKVAYVSAAKGPDRDSKTSSIITPAEWNVYDASVAGDRATLRIDATIPMLMALLFLALIVYFKALGGYRFVGIRDKSQ